MGGSAGFRLSLTARGAQIWALEESAHHMETPGTPTLRLGNRQVTPVLCGAGGCWALSPHLLREEGTLASRHSPSPPPARIQDPLTDLPVLGCEWQDTAPPWGVQFQTRACPTFGHSGPICPDPDAPGCSPPNLSRGGDPTPIPPPGGQLSCVLLLPHGHSLVTSPGVVSGCWGPRGV